MNIYTIICKLQSRIAKRQRAIASAEASYTSARMLWRRYNDGDELRLSQDIRNRLKVEAQEQKIDKTALQAMYSAAWG